MANVCLKFFASLYFLLINQFPVTGVEKKILFLKEVHLFHHIKKERKIRKKKLQRNNPERAMKFAGFQTKSSKVKLFHSSQTDWLFHQRAKPGLELRSYPNHLLGNLKKA